MKRLFYLLLLLSALAFLAGAAEKPGTVKMKPVLVVMDIQNAFMPMMDAQDTKRGMEYINYFIHLFRNNGFPVVRVYHSDPQRGPKPGSEEFEFPKTVAIQADDPMVVKNFGNAFKKTELDKLLKEKGCNTVFLCGLSAVGCVLSTYFGADELDYDVFMVKNALISHDATLTRHVQEICRTIDYAALKLLLENVRQ